MLKLSPILLAVAYGLVLFFFSSKRLSADLTQNSTLLTDPILDQHCRLMAQNVGLDKITVYVHEVEPVNGLAATDGRIFITRGFMNKYRDGSVTSEELASVIAHELGHIALGHARRRMIDFSAQNAIRVTLSMILGRIIPGLGIYAANILTSLLAARLSRSDEYEADAYAAALLEKSGIGIAPQITLFEKLGRLTGATGQPMAWLMSHPKTEDRIKAIEHLKDGWA
ncbi:MAG: M48 family metalloprotease [Pseudomonadota bacterium]